MFSSDFNSFQAHQILHDLGDLTKPEKSGSQLFVNANTVKIGVSVFGKLTQSFSQQSSDLKDLPPLIDKISSIAINSFKKGETFTSNEIDEAIKGLTFYCKQEDLVKKEDLHYLSEAISSLSLLKEMINEFENEKQKFVFIGDSRQPNIIKKEEIGEVITHEETKLLEKEYTKSIISENKTTLSAIYQLKNLTYDYFPLPDDLEKELTQFFDNELKTNKFLANQFQDFIEQCIQTRQINLKLIESGKIPRLDDPQITNLAEHERKLKEALMDSNFFFSKLKDSERSTIIVTFLNTLVETAIVFNTQVHTDTFNYIRPDQRNQNSVNKSSLIADQIAEDLKNEKDISTIIIKTNEFLLRKNGFIPRGMIFNKSSFSNVDIPFKGTRIITLATSFGKIEEVRVDLDLTPFSKLDKNQHSCLLNFIAKAFYKETNEDLENLCKELSVDVLSVDFLSEEERKQLFDITKKFNNDLQERLYKCLLKLSNPQIKETSYLGYAYLPFSYLGNAISSAYSFLPNIRSKTALVNFKEDQFEDQIKNINILLKILKSKEKDSQIIELVDKQIIDLVDYFLNENKELYPEEMKKKLLGRFETSLDFHRNFAKFIVQMLEIRPILIEEIHRSKGKQFPVAHLKNDILTQSYIGLLKESENDDELRRFVTILCPCIIKHFQMKYTENLSEIEKGVMKFQKDKDLEKLKVAIKDPDLVTLITNQVESNETIKTIEKFNNEVIPKKLRNYELVSKIIERGNVTTKLEGKNGNKLINLNVPSQFIKDLKRFQYVIVNGITLHDQDNIDLKIETENQEAIACKEMFKMLGRKNFNHACILMNQFLPNQIVMGTLNREIIKFNLIANNLTPFTVEITKTDGNKALEGSMKWIAEIKDTTKPHFPLGYMVCEMKINFPDDTDDLSILEVKFTTHLSPEQELEKNESLKSKKTPFTVPVNPSKTIKISNHLSPIFKSVDQAKAYLKDL